ncbi:epoxyqueuosine reductase [Nanoarchaeota archaeon]
MDLKEKITNSIIGNVLLSSKSNSWKDPLVGFASTDDRLFVELKRVISPTHYTPFRFQANAKTVISYFIPFIEDVPKSNKNEKDSKERIASKFWAGSYVSTNNMIVEINNYIAKFLNDEGFESTVIPPTHNFYKDTLISDWSHKHVAYIAGLGNFGLHQMLITDKGCCGRLGSLVTSAEIEPTERSDKEYCLYKSSDGEKCGVCVEKCVSGALTVDGLDKHKCYEVCLENDKHYAEKGINEDTDVCGKCVSIVPCSFKNPVKD